LDEGELGTALVMHCVHRNVAAPSFMTGPMLITNSAVHEIDIARFVLGGEVRRVTVVTPRKTGLSGMQDPQIVLLEMDEGVVVDAEIFVNAQYGYDVRAELVCEKGTIALTPPHDVIVRHSGQEGSALASDWRPRFALAYRAELQAWVEALRSGVPAGASAWDGYVATAVAEAGLKSLASELTGVFSRKQFRLVGSPRRGDSHFAAPTDYLQAMFQSISVMVCGSTGSHSCGEVSS
jgi:myo-inositol 2-dehydrogenase/D-chiro-inositol 1-dehydrogenase